VLDPAAALEPTFPEPDDEPEPVPDGLLDPLPAEEEAEGAAEQDEELPVVAPEADPPAAALACPVPDDGDSPVVGAAFDVPAEAHPAVGLGVDDEDEVGGADGAAPVELAADEPDAGAGAAEDAPADDDPADDEPADDEPADDDPADDDPADDDPADDEPPAAADEAPEEPVPALADWLDPALADWPELAVPAVEPAVDELEDAPLVAADPCVVAGVADAVVPEAEPAGDAETRLVLVETDVPIALCSDAEELTPAAFAHGATSMSVSTAAATQHHKMPR